MYRRTAGPSHDLEMFAYERQSYVTLTPPIVSRQAEQLLDFQNRHTEDPQVSQMTGYHTTNPLPFERFVGTFRRHVNEPLPLSVNEVMHE